VVVPPWLLVILDNTTKNTPSLGSATSTHRPMEPGKHMLGRWSAPTGTETPQMCLCPPRGDPSCPCEPRHVRGIEIVYVQCRNTEWRGVESLGTPKRTSGAVTSVAGILWLRPDEQCNAIGVASATYDLRAVSPGAAGTVDIHYPWTPDRERVAVAADAVAANMELSMGSGDGPLLKIQGAAPGQPLVLPILDGETRALEVELAGEAEDAGTLDCTFRPGAGPTSIRAFIMPGPGTFTAVGRMSTRWSGSQRARVCLREDDGSHAEVTFTVPRLLLGQVYELPAWLPTAAIAIEVPRPALRLFRKCPAGRASVVTVDPALGAAPVMLSADNQTQTPRWQLEPVAMGNRHVALLCDPPKTAVNTRLDAGIGDPRPRRYRLSAAAVKAIDAAPPRPPPAPPPPRDVCVYHGQDVVNVKLDTACRAPCRPMPPGSAEFLDVNRRMDNMCRVVCRC
jgi:hypothetical protein